MRGECNAKVGKLCFHNFDTAEPKLILYKDNGLSYTKIKNIPHIDNYTLKKQKHPNALPHTTVCPLHHNAPASRDAKSCVSRAMTVYHHWHIIIHTHCTDLLVRRKILRLYFSKQRILICTRHPIPTPSPRNAMTDSTYRQPPHGGFAMKPCRAAVAMLSRMKRTAGAGMTHIPAVRQLRLSVSG